jgi:MEMO1 family protein
MIKSAFITPHSPILIPNIGKSNLSIIEKTSKSFLTIREKIMASKSDTIIVISPHLKDSEEITINNHFKYDLSFEEFGDYSSKISFPGDMSLAYKIKEEAEPDFWINLRANNKPDYGSAIPIYRLLTETNQRIKDFKGRIIIINTSLKKDLLHHFDFGKKISSLLEEEENNISIIASGELSHCLTRNAPGGFFSKAISFDEKTIESIKKGRAGVEKLLKTDNKIAREAKECGLRPIVTMLGIIGNRDYSPKTISYQKDLGVGYLSMDMNI